MQKGVSNSDVVAANKRRRNKAWLERQERSRDTREEHVTLQAKIDALRDNIPDELPEKFSDLPLSARTQLGLERGNFKKMTVIQQESLYYTLTGRDVLGAAKTGSGKTLCFIIPVLERLYLEKWSTEDGVGAMVLTPTRELALQIFKVLQVVGYKHTFSAALLTGGRDVREERKRIHVISIVVGTPGRILQHLSEEAGFTVDNLQMLVMDEADRLLDMGFRETITGILEHLPGSRQTLLFSATQTQDVKALAEMSLNNPKYIAAHAMSLAPTPSRMCQNFMIVELHRKLDALLMFIKRHPNDKTVVFISTCNQVKFMYLAFSKILKKMRVPSMCLTGKMKQFRREEVFLTFCRCKSAVLFCTDIAARGLDFPMVHWVVQYDCPDSPQTYIHRVGRTARAGARGATILFLTPRETPMLNLLHQAKLPLREIKMKSGLLQESKQIFVALVVQGLKYEAQKAFTAYLRSLHFAANRAVFDFASVDLEKFAHSLGLLVVPNTAEVTNMQRSAKNVSWDVLNFIANNGAANAKAAAKAAAKAEAEASEDDEDDGSDDDDGSEDGADEGEKQARQPQQQQLTRRERHLKASDMFRQLHMKQARFSRDGGDGDATAGDATAGAGGSGGADKSSSSDDEELFTVHRKTMADLAGNGGNDANGASGKGGNKDLELTFEERLAGLSKNKKKWMIQEADLRVKDLGLSKRTVFDAVEEEGAASDEEKGVVVDDGRGSGSHRRAPAAARATEASAKPAVVKKLDGLQTAVSSSEDSDAASDELAFEEKLRSRMLNAKEDDTARQKALRRRRTLKKAGRLRDDEDGDAAAAVKGGGAKTKKGGGGGGDYDSDSSLSYDEETKLLLKAARGEMTSSDDDDDNNGDAGEEERGDDDVEDEEEVQQAPPKRRARK